MKAFYITNQLPRKAQKGIYKKAIKLADGRIDNGLLYIPWDDINRGINTRKILRGMGVQGDEVEVYIVNKGKSKNDITQK